jgi:hypothetical protein
MTQSRLGFLFLFLSILEILTNLTFATSAYLVNNTFPFTVSFLNILFFVIGRMWTQEELKKCKNIGEYFTMMVLEIHSSLILFAIISFALFVSYSPLQWIYMTRGLIELAFYIGFRNRD